VLFWVLNALYIEGGIAWTTANGDWSPINQ